MKRIISFLISIIALCSANLRADFPTPFIDINVKVGQTVTGRCWIIQHWHSENFIVLAVSDTGQFFPLSAGSEKGIIKPSHLGRPVIVTAKVLEEIHEEGKAWWLALKIIKVEEVKKSK